MSSTSCPWSKQTGTNLSNPGNASASVPINIGAWVADRDCLYVVVGGDVKAAELVRLTLDPAPNAPRVRVAWRRLRAVELEWALPLPGAAHPPAAHGPVDEPSYSLTERVVTPGSSTAACLQHCVFTKPAKQVEVGIGAECEDIAGTRWYVVGGNAVRAQVVRFNPAQRSAPMKVRELDWVGLVATQVRPSVALLQGLSCSALRREVS